jgi:hypothetical protein
MAKVAPIFEALGKETSQLASSYSTRELETIKDFCERVIEIMRQHTEMAQTMMG